MSKRVCNVPNCPTLTDDGGQCVTHRREADKARGSRQQRGYGAGHTTERERWAPKVATGAVMCARCGHYIDAGVPWDLGHNDDDRRQYTGPEHQACNRATAGRR